MTIAPRIGYPNEITSPVSGSWLILSRGGGAGTRTGSGGSLFEALDPGIQAESIEHIRNAVGAQVGRTVGDVEMEMGEVGVAAVAHESEDLAAADAIADTDPLTSRLEVGVHGKPPVPVVDGDKVPRRPLEGHRLGGNIRGRVVGYPVTGGDDDPGRSGTDLVSVGEVALVLRRISRIEVELLVDPQEIDGEALRHVKAALHFEQGEAMTDVPPAATEHHKIVALERWADAARGTVVDRGLGASDHERRL